MSFFRWLFQLVRYQIGLKIISILIGITLWVVVFGSRTIEITKEVPFEVVMADDQILVEPPPDKIVFRLTGPKAFLRTLVNRMEDPIRANIKNLKTGTFTQRIYSDSLKLPMGVKVQSINPNVVQIKVEELKHKSMPVKLETVGEIPSGFKATRMEVLPPYIKLKGQKNRITSMTVFQSLPIDLSAIRETSVIPLAFDFKGNGVDPDSPLPELYVEIQGRGQAYRIRHVPLKVRSTLKANVSVDDVTIIVRTDLNSSVKVEGEQVSAEIDVRDYPAGEYQKWIHVDLPANVHLVKVVPPMTKVSVQAP